MFGIMLIILIQRNLFEKKNISDKGLTLPPRPPAHEAVTPKNVSFQNINSIIYSDLLWLLECLEHELKVKIKFPVCYRSTGKWT